MSFGCREVEKQEIQWLQPRCALVFRCAPQSTMVLISGSNSQTADLLWALNLPYKFTYAGFVLVCILCAFMATTCPAPAKFMWFGELKSSVLSCVNLKILRMYPNNLGIWGAPQL